jgi:imidazolonepropionase-like amidohydrolase
MSDGRLVFTGARLLDGVNTARDGVSVVVEGNRISAVRDGAVETGEADHVIDLAGKTLMPGMVQCHFHTGFGPTASGGVAPILGLEAPSTYMGMIAAYNARIALDCGVTSIIGSSNADGLDVSLKDAIVLGVVEGPRVLACSHEFMTTGEQADGDNRSWFMQLGNKGLVRSMSGAEAFRQATREEVGRGCDIVKISIARGHGSAPAWDVNYLTDDELEAVVSTAHERGALVRAHCPSRIGVIECARGGVDIIDHADRIDDEGIEAVLAADATVVPSMLWSERFLGFADSWDHSQAPFPIGEGFPEKLDQTLARLAAVREDYEYTQQALARMQAAGVRLVLGDDYGFPMMPHGDYVSEMELYARFGASPLEIVRWATKNGAEAMGQGDELGMIEENRLADLVVIDGDPSADISSLRMGVRMVIKDGAIVRDHLAA